MAVRKVVFLEVSCDEVGCENKFLSSERWTKDAEKDAVENRGWRYGNTTGRLICIKCYEDKQIFRYKFNT
jgi:hypothetical protein